MDATTDNIITDLKRGANGMSNLFSINESHCQTQLLLLLFEYM